MEDVDAAGKVVHRRAPAGGGVAQTRTVTRTIVRNPTHGPTTAGISRQATGAHDDATRPTPLLLPSRGRSERMGRPPTPKAGAHAKLAPTDEVNDKDQAKLEPAHNGTSPAGAAVAAAMAAAAATATEHEAEAEAEVTEEIVMVEAGPFAKDKKSLFDDEDKLDLAGLLNVLDGVVDSPNRIVSRAQITPGGVAFTAPAHEWHGSLQGMLSCTRRRVCKGGCSRYEEFTGAPALVAPFHSASRVDALLCCPRAIRRG